MIFVKNMVLSLSRIIKSCILKTNTNSINQAKSFSTRKTFCYKKAILSTLGVISGGVGVILYTLDQSVKASDLELHPPKQKWYHTGFIRSLDHASVRRGYEVFKQVCSACHSIRFVRYRELIGETHSEAEAKAEAEEQMIEDGPDEHGNMFKRPGKLSDSIPGPYKNEEAARSANSGSFPPDLSYIIPARNGGEDYIFSLLTGYCEPPAGVTLREGLHYNPYFLGGAIAMAPPLFQDSAEYSDGTYAHASQLAKDVTNFLKWTAEPEHDTRKLMIIKSTLAFAILTGLSFYLFRSKFISVKTRKIAFRTKSDSSKKCN